MVAPKPCYGEHEAQRAAAGSGGSARGESLGRDAEAMTLVGVLAAVG
jgi:hypothetical protein